MTALPKTSKPAERALASIGVTTLEDVAKHAEKDLLALHGFGPQAIGILKPALAAAGLTFKA